jgi:pimeloyl-ACP methyl ester carboxylesterase
MVTLAVRQSKRHHRVLPGLCKYGFGTRRRDLHEANYQPMIMKSILVILLACLIPIGCSGQDREGPASRQIPVGIDKLLTPDIGGIRQFVEIKTDDSSKPVLLFLSGGPGSSMMNNSGSFTNILRKSFTIVQWDQRNAGKTLKLNPSPSQPSVEQMGRDTLQVIKFLMKELNQEKIYLLGSSWGSVLGFYIVRNHPDLLHAYFAVNPVVSQLASEKELLEILTSHFKDNALASKELAGVSIPFKKDTDLFYLRKWLFYRDGKDFALGDDFRIGFLEWSKAWSPVWNEVMGIDLPRTLRKVDVPVYFFVGKSDIQTSMKITKRYFDELKAPKKDLFIFEHSGHQIHQDEPEKLQSTIVKTLDTIKSGN